MNPIFYSLLNSFGVIVFQQLRQNQFLGQKKNYSKYATKPQIQIKL
jgi:hypothetical protein